MKNVPDTKKLVTEAMTLAEQMGGVGQSLDSKMAEAIYTIDKYFGDGFAKNHPELLGQCIHSSMLGSMCYGNIEDALNAIADTRGTVDAVKEVAEALRQLYTK